MGAVLSYASKTKSDIDIKQEHLTGEGGYYTFTDGKAYRGRIRNHTGGGLMQFGSLIGYISTRENLTPAFTDVSSGEWTVPKGQLPRHTLSKTFSGSDHLVVLPETPDGTRIVLSATLERIILE